jgi:hypothetical protein
MPLFADTGCFVLACDGLCGTNETFPPFEDPWPGAVRRGWGLQQGHDGQWKRYCPACFTSRTEPLEQLPIAGDP